MNAQQMTHLDALNRINDLRRDDDVVVGTMTSGTIWPTISRHSKDISLHAPMGIASSFGLGVALGRPDLGVIVLDSDGAILMNLGTLVTIGGEKPAKFLHVVFENGVYDMTGGQGLPGSGTSGLAAAAVALGYASAERVDEPESIDRAVNAMHQGDGPILLLIPVTRDFADLDLAAVGNSPAVRERTGAAGFAHLTAEIAAR